MMTDTDSNRVLSVLRERRSVRNYTDREVSDEILRTIIAAGIQAPTALGFQPWQFVVVRDRDLMQRASDYCKPILAAKIAEEPRPGTEAFLAALKNPEYSIFYNAPVLVLVLGAREVVSSAVDCTLCAGNMMLAAWALGLGSCWIGSAALVQQSPDLLAALKVPEDHQIVAPLIFGYPAPLQPKPERREPRITWVR
ncbi:nitroreductase family protein [Methanoculleus sp. 7T]|uniref:nitroreductase family protein n=1 Tax=Methanoculleus sp. 7T TaxID=2937282 RepID=UPI0020BDC6C9|nr:nitroreductase family protein [Methanoculleus sp. 7T]MCK8519766.1 nitroreductase family protein [Methanoculleus sp. 7T]